MIFLLQMRLSLIDILHSSKIHSSMTLFTLQHHKILSLETEREQWWQQKAASSSEWDVSVIQMNTQAIHVSILRFISHTFLTTIMNKLLIVEWKIHGMFNGRRGSFFFVLKVRWNQDCELEMNGWNGKGFERRNSRKVEYLIALKCIQRAFSKGENEFNCWAINFYVKISLS